MSLMAHHTPQLFPLADLVAGFVFESEGELTAFREWEPASPVNLVEE
jgi:hypothetical protein